MDTERIMVALDGSTMAEAALPVAESLASRTETVFILVRAAEAPDGLADVMAARLDELGAAAKYLDGVAATLRARGFEKVETVARYGPAAAVILEAARAHDADVIVIATSGRRGIGRLVFGSVAETVVRGTQTPVFLVRAGDVPRDTVRRSAVSRERERAHEAPTPS
jgi:nucleotide-binding universal stress UspA family protein